MAANHKAPVLTWNQRLVLEVALLRQGLNDHAGMWRQMDKKMPLATKFFALITTAFPNTGSKEHRAEQRARRLEVLSFLLGRQIKTTEDMTLGEVSAMTSWMEDPETRRARKDAVDALKLLRRAEYREYVSSHV